MTPTSSKQTIQRALLLQPALLLLLAFLLTLSQAFIPPSARALRNIKMMATPPGAVAYPIRVAFQGEPGAYSEKALRELLGPHVVAIGKPSFDDTFKVSPDYFSSGHAMITMMEMVVIA